MVNLENQFQKSEIFFKFGGVGKEKNKESNTENFYNSHEYKSAFLLGKQLQERVAYTKSLPGYSKHHYYKLKKEVYEKTEDLAKLKSEFNSFKKHISGIDRKVQETKPTMYFFSGLFTLFLTMVSATTIKINFLYLNNFNGWQTMLIIVGIIFAIFLVSIIFYLIAGYLFLRHSKKLDLQHLNFDKK